MERANKLTKIIAVLSIISVALVERASGIQVYYENLNSLRELCRIKHKDIESYSEIQGKIDTKTYKGDSSTYLLAKNLSSDGENQTNTNNNSIVMTDYDFISSYLHNFKHFPLKDSTENNGNSTNGILLAPYLCAWKRRNLLAQLKEAERQKNSPTEAEKEDRQMNADMDLMKRVLNMMICKSYTNDFVNCSENTHKLFKDDFKKGLENLKLEDSTGYSILFKKNMTSRKEEDMPKLFEIYEADRNKIMHMLIGLDGQTIAHNQETEVASGVKTLLKKMFKNGVEEIMKILKNQYESDEQFLSTDECNGQIIDILSSMVVDKSENEDTEDTKQTIRDILSEITEELTNSPNTTVDNAVKRTNNDILDMILRNLDATEDTFAVKIENMVRQCIEEIINVLANPNINRAKYKTFNLIMDEIKRDEEYLGSQNLNETLGRLLNFVDNFHHQPTSSTVIDAPYYHFAECIEVLQEYLDNELDDNWATENITVTKIRSLATLMTATHFVSETIQSLKSYSSIWNNPAMLVVTKFSSASCLVGKKYKAILIYYRPTEDENDKPYHKKEIIYSNTNIATFKNARTVQDLEDIREYYV